MAQDTFLQDLDAAYAKAQSATPAAPASQPVQTPEEASGGVGGFASDFGQAVAGGVEAAGRGTLQTMSSIAQLTGMDTPDVPQATMIANPKYGFNKVVKDITQYGLGFLAGGVALKGVGLAAKTTAGFMGQSALGTGIVADPHAERLSNLLQQYPFLEKPMSLLAADPGDSAAAGKVKAALEDAFTTPVALGLFKAIHYGFKSTRGLWKNAKEADEATTDLQSTLTQLNEAAEAGSLKAEKYADNIEQHLNLNTHIPTKVLTMPSEVDKGFRQVKLKDLRIEEADHTGPVVPEKVENLRGVVKEKADTLPPISVEEFSDGTMKLLDGRHRSAAAQAEGFTHATAKVIRSKDTDKLMSLENKVGGKEELNTAVKAAVKAGDSKELDLAATRIQKGREAFNLSDDQFKLFEDRVAANLVEGETNELFSALPDGAFNYSKMANRFQVHSTLQAMADVIAPNLEKNVKAHMSFDEIRKAANLFGTKPEVMMANLRTWGTDAKNLAPTLIAAKNWAQKLSQEIYRDARSVAIMGTGGETAKIEMMRKVSILADLEGMMKSVQTAAARTTAAGRMRTRPTFTGKKMLEMLDEVGGADKVLKLAEKLALTEGKPENVTKLLRVSMARKIVDTHNELWINSLLSGISTHVVNMTTAGINTFIKPGNIALGGLIRGDKASVDAGVGTWRAMGSMFKDSFEMARRAWDIERPLLSVTDKQLEMESTISAGNYNLNPESWLGQGVNWLGKAARIPSRFLGAEDEFFKQLSYRAKLHHDATVEAMSLMREGKLNLNNTVDVLIDGKTVKLSEVDAHIQNRFNEGFDYEMMPELSARQKASGEAGDMRQVRGNQEDTLNYANEATFTQNLKVPTWLGNRSFAETMYQTANSHPMLRGTVLPFVKVPANLLREGASYTPGIAQLRKKFWSDLAEGGERASEAIGKMATGSMLLASATMLAVEGKITGGAPTDPDIRNRMYEKGWQPYSFVFTNSNGENTYVPFSRFDPYGLVFGIVGDIAQTFQHAAEDARHSVAASATMAVANMLNSRSYLKGLVDTLDVLSGGQGQDGIDKFNKIMNSRAASYIPNLVRVAQPDTELKEIRSMVDAMMAKTPGLSQSVPAKRGYFGDKLMAPVGWPWHSILPSKPGQETSDPALQELARLSDGPAQAHFQGPEKRVGTLDLTRYKNADGVTAYDRMLEKLSETDFHDKMNELVQSDRYLAGNDGDAFYPGSKQVMIKKLETEYHHKALEATLREFQDQASTLGFDLREMYLTDKKNARASKHGRETSEIDRLLELVE